MNTVDFEVVESLLREKFSNMGYFNLGLSSVFTGGNRRKYYIVSIDEAAIDKIKYFGSVSETLEKTGNRCKFRLYLDEIEDFLKR